MANPQPDQFTRLSNELYEAIMKTDFSKRQRNILDLIIRLSYGCRKKFAVLRPSDFEVVGVLRGHIKKELDFMRMANVLHIDGETFTLNKDYDSWRVSLSKAFNPDKFHKILARNLYQNVTETATKVTKTVTKNEDGLDEALPKQEQRGYQNRNSAVTETVTGILSEPLSGASFGPSKDILKKSTKSSSRDSTSSTGQPPPDFSFSRIYRIYETHFVKDQVTEFEAEELGMLFDDYGGEWIYEAMREATRHKIMTLAYVDGILKGFKNRGGPKREPPSSQLATRPPVYQVNDDDPITKLLREVSHASAGES